MVRITSLIFLLALSFHTASQETNNATAAENELLGNGANQGAGIPSSYTEGSLRGSLILENGTIFTMNSRGPVVTVVGIDDGRIVYVGNSSSDAAKLFFRTPRVLNLRGRMAVPGLIDCHNHIAILGNKPGYHHPLDRSFSIADIQALYGKAAIEVPKGKFITTVGGFHPNQFREARLPTLAELDLVTPNHPVFLSAGFNGPSATNTLGKSIFEALPLDLRPVIASNGTIAQGLENGKALLSLRRNLTFADRQRSVRAAMAYAASTGVTTHLDQGAFPATDTPADWSANEDLYTYHQPWLSVYAAGEGIIRLRINFLHYDNDTSSATIVNRLQNTFPFFGNSMVRTGGIGEFVVEIDDYAGGTVFEAAVRKIAAAQWRLEIHSLNATDFQTQIQVFEAMDREYGISKLRWVLAHVPLITPAYLSRLRRLGMGVNLSGWLFLAGTGNETHPAGPPMRDIVASGIPMGGGADGPNVAPISPWPHIYYFVTGKNALGEVINPGQQATRAEVLRMFTSANTWFLGEADEDQLGVLEVGRLGDVAVLSEDYFAVPDEKLKSLTSVLTVVGGAVVHRDGSF